MKLRSLRMQLFRQHADGVVYFPDGLVGIVGINGSGKTTIVEAVGFALFGSRALRGRTDDVRTRNAPSKSGRGKREQEMLVELFIEHDATVFRIVRSLSDATLYAGGEANPLAVGNREVSARVAALIGMSYEEFVATYCTEQKGLEFLSGKKGATERERFIIRVLGYDRIEELQEMLRSDRKETRAILQGYEASIGTREELEQRLRDEEGKLIAVREKHDVAAQALSKSEAEFEVLRARMQKLEESRTRFIKERDAVQTAQVRLEERLKRQQSLADSGVVAEDELRRALKPLAGNRTLDEVSNDTKREAALVKGKVDARIAELQQAERQWQDEISKIRAEREALLRQAQVVSQKVSKLDALDAGSECPTCSQPLGETFEAVHTHLASERDQLMRRAAELQAQESERGETPSHVCEIQAALQDEKSVLERLQTKLFELQQCQQLEQKLQGVRQDQRAMEADINSARSTLERAQVKLKECNFSEEDYSKDKGAHDAAQRLVEVARLQRVRLEGEVNTQMALVARSAADLEKFEERYNELQRIRHEVRLFDECDRVVTDFRKYVNSSIRPRMAELASEYLTDLTDGRYSAVELGDDFTPTVVEDGEAKRVISGGEEDILNLCMRLALSHMLAERAGQSFSLLMLDEVFGSLDEGRRSNVLALLEKLRRRFEQIIIITHLDDIKDGVHHLIQVEYDESSGGARISNSSDSTTESSLAVNI